MGVREQKKVEYHCIKVFKRETFNEQAAGKSKYGWEHKMSTSSTDFCVLVYGETWSSQM